MIMRRDAFSYLENPGAVLVIGFGRPLEAGLIGATVETHRTDGFRDLQQICCERATGAGG